MKVIPGSMLEKGLNFALHRKERLADVRFQIQVITSNLDPENTQAKGALDKLLMDYNNWMYPHIELERKDFVKTSKVKFAELKNAHKKMKLKEMKIDPNEQFKISIGK